MTKKAASSIAATGTRSKRKAPAQPLQTTATKAAKQAAGSAISPAQKKRRATTPRKHLNAVPFPLFTNSNKEVINLYDDDDDDDEDEEEQETKHDDGDGFRLLGVGGAGLFFEDASDDFELLAQAKPDVHLPSELHGHVRVIMVGRDEYDAMLTRTCVHQNQNEFMLLQALQSDAFEFYVWSRSGLVGSEGETQLQGPYPTAGEAIQVFQSIFLDKTRVDWDQRESLHFGEGGFTWIQTFQTEAKDEDAAAAETLSAWKRRSSKKSRARTSRKTKPKPLMEIVVDKSAFPQGTSPPPSRLDEEVQKFLTMITDAASAFNDPRFYSNKPVKKSKALTAAAADVNAVCVSIPLGKPSRKTIERGLEALHNIHDALQVKADRTALTHLSSRFYSVVPHTQLLVIDSMVRLTEKVEMLVALSVHSGYDDLIRTELTRRYFRLNQLDVSYHDLDCRLIPLLPTSREFGLVQSYIFNSFCCMGNDYAADGKLVTVFRVDKLSDAERFKPFRSAMNRRVLWHGSRMSNWPGILKHGLLITPAGVPLNGSSLGAGLYFTDKISKAMAYSHASHDHQVFLLSEVALGQCKPSLNSASIRNVKSASATAHHSCHGMGRCVPDSAGDFTDAFGAVWPLGKATQTKDVRATHGHNEFVVYNTAQARMRYIVVTRPLY